MVEWLSGFRAQTGSVAYWRSATFVRHLGETAAPGEGVRAVPRLCIEYPGICLATDENHGNPQGNRMVLGCSAPNAIRFVDLAIADDGLD